MQFNEDYNDSYGEEQSSYHNIFTILAILVAVLGLISLSFYAYKSYKTNKDDAEIPLIAADNSAVKLQPTDPGGMKFPNMDKKVYDTVSKNSNSNVERVLSSPEEPLSKDEITRKYAQNNQEQEVEVIDLRKETKETEVEIEGTKIESSKLDELKADFDHIKKEEESLITEEKPVGVPTNHIKKLPRGSKFKEKDFNKQNFKKYYRVQIASFKSEKDAKLEWKNKLTVAAEMFQDQDHYIEKKTIPKKGLVYRLQVGSFTSESDAVEFCRKLKSKEIDCFTVRP